jgi:hypothetical protein
MKDEKIKINKEDIKIRKTWPNKNEFDPSEKVHKVKTDYQRQNNKQEIQKALDEMEDDLDLYE